MLKKSTFIVVIILALSTIYHAVYAQMVPGMLTSVHYNGIAFNYSPEALGAVLPNYDLGTVYQVDAPYFANVAQHISFKFLRPDPTYPDIDLVAELRIYRILDLQAYPEPTYWQVVEQLRNLGAGDLSAYANVNVGYDTPTLPFMPVLNATQVFRVRPDAWNTTVISGIEYYAYYGVTLEPILDGQILYVYQGITADGKYYVSFSTPVETGLLQTTMPNALDMDTFTANYSRYLRNIFASINNARPETFAPTPAVLHQFIESISFNL